MKKIALLTLVILVALPGCGKKKSTQPAKKANIAQYMNTEGSIEPVEDREEDIDGEDESSEDEDSEDVESYLDGLEFDDEDEKALEDDSIEAAFTWIDAQTDDEFKTLYFSFNHYGVRADQKQAVEYDVAQVKQLLSESGTTAQPTVVIEGHACQEGTPAYNLALSEKRAKNIADLFVAAGVERSAIKVVGRGSECPAVNGGTREARGPNRRVEVRVIYT